jgi:hypothetical protein
MILIDTQTKKPCYCSDCLKQRIINSDWGRKKVERKINLDSVQKVEIGEPWWERI